MPQPAPVSPPARTEFVATDLELAREFLDQAYGSRLLMTSSGESSAGLAVIHVDCGRFGLSDVAMPVDLTFHMAGQGAVVIATVIDGTLQADRSAVTDRYEPGDVFIANFPQAHYTVHTHGNRNHGVVLPLDLLATIAGPSAGRPGPPQFVSLHPVTTAARARWMRTTGYIGGLLADPDAAASPLIIGSAARLLAATALTIFPNTALTDPTIEDRHDSHPDTLRRAISYIEANADHDVGVADIAQAAYVTVRTIQLAFRRHLGTTPMAYLRRVRLDRARDDLRNADPGQGTTVTTIATRWGFASPSRFAAFYRNAYGVLPSHTLRS